MRFWVNLQTLMVLYIFHFSEGRVKSSHNISRHVLLKSKPDKIQSLQTSDGKTGEKSFIQTKTAPRYPKKLRRKSITRRTTLPENKENNFRLTKTIITEKFQHISPAERKSGINNNENQGKSPVMYNSLDGKDSYMIIRSNRNPQQSQALQRDIPLIPSLPSKTFLVTVYGDEVEDAEEKIRNALTEPKTCPCKCSRAPCEHTEICPCDEGQEDQATQEDQSIGLQAGRQKLILFPNAGKPFGRFGCVCPCCLCSCSEPGLENYNCGCQNSPPVSCPCSANTNPVIEPQISMPAGSNCQCGATSQAPCSCEENLSPVSVESGSVVTVGNQIASWTGKAPSCPCQCCECACAQPETYPDYQCGCMNQLQAATPCPCNNQGLGTSSSRSGSENVVQSLGNIPSPENNPYPSQAQSNVPQSPANSPYPSTAGNNMGQSTVNNPSLENSPNLAAAANVAQSPGINPYSSTNQNDVVRSPANSLYS